MVEEVKRQASHVHDKVCLCHVTEWWLCMCHASTVFLLCRTLLELLNCGHFNDLGMDTLYKMIYMYMYSKTFNNRPTLRKADNLCTTDGSLAPN